MVDLENDPMWVVTVTMTTSLVAPTLDDAIRQVVETIASENEHGGWDDLNLGAWGQMLPFDVTNISAEEIEE